MASFVLINLKSSWRRHRLHYLCCCLGRDITQIILHVLFTFECNYSAVQKAGMFNIALYNRTNHSRLCQWCCTIVFKLWLSGPLHRFAQIASRGGGVEAAASAFDQYELLLLLQWGVHFKVSEQQISGELNSDFIQWPSLSVNIVGLSHFDSKCEPNSNIADQNWIWRKY